MKKLDINALAQLSGLAGVMASLIFVGLELRQSQTIALAAQQQARTEVFTDLMNSLTESGINYQELATTSQGDEQEIAALMNFAHSMLWVFENDFLQYRLGLVDETLWTSKLNILIANFSSCLGRAVFNQRKIGLDKNFVALMEDNLPADCLTDDELLELLRVPD
tara:strand:+ start:429 stop:923 length:495 start_codon:yes stop_codon:yes gene_type:complete